VKNIINLKINKMNTLTRIEIAQNKLNNLQLVDLTSFSKSEKKSFWSSVSKEYLSQFDKLTAS